MKTTARNLFVALACVFSFACFTGCGVRHEETIVVPIPAGGPAKAAAPSAVERPNVVIVLTDDQRWDAVSFNRETAIQTPHIDRLAKEGVFFENYFCTTSLCSPSRASILSGLYAHAHGVVNNFTDYPKDLASFPRVLQSEGYDTAYIGKWHMGEKSDEPRPGFDYFVTHKGQGKYWDTEFNFHGKERKVVKGYYTTVVTDMAQEWIHKERGDQPFMLMLGHKAPHSFYYPEPKYSNTFAKVSIPYPESAFKLEDNPEWIKKRLTTWHGIYGPLFDWRKKFPDTRPEAVKDFEAMTRAYWGTILSVDDSVGRLYNELKKTGELDNTLFIFTSDNGLLSGEHGMVDKRTMHEASIRIPLIVRYPGLTPPDQPRVVKKQVLTLDIAPSVLEICGAPALKDIHGASFKRLAMGDESGWRDAWYYEYNYEVQFPYTPNVRGIRTDEWKYMRYPHGDGSPDKHMAELYHISKDPMESKNLINDPKHADLIKKLRVRLDELITEAGDGKPDNMPLDEGIKTFLPDESIR